MLKTKLFTKAKLCVLGLSLWASGTAQNLPDGKHWQTAKPAPIKVSVENQIELRVNAALATDSVLWKIQGSNNVTAANPLTAKTDLYGNVYYKSDTLWKVDSFAFNGITIAPNDSMLIAPSFDNASYRWSFNGSTLPNSSNYVFYGNSGTYTVVISLESAPFDTLRYSRYVFRANQGDTPNNAIADTNLISHDLNHFWIADTQNVQLIQWQHNNQSVYSSRYLLLEDGTLTAFVLKNGKWYRDEVTFYGIRKDGNLLRANVSAKEYQWYKNGVAVGGTNSSSIDVSIYGKGSYSLVATFITSKGPQNGIYFDFTTEKLGTFDNPITGYNWIQRSGDSLVIVTPSGLNSFDFVFWKSQTVGGIARMDSGSHVFVLKEPTTVHAFILSDGLWYQDGAFFVNGVDSTHGSYENPIDTIHVQREGFTLSVPSSFGSDSSFWYIVADDTTILPNITRVGSSIDLYYDAKVVVMTYAHGLWFRQNIDFKGIVVEPSSEVLQAPVIANAQYEWFFNDAPLGVFTSSYKPTAAGTYKVVINWVESGQSLANQRVSEVQKTAVFTFVLDRVTSIEEESRALAALNMYPNPAQESVSFEGKADFIEYRIEDLSAAIVKEGQTNAGSTISLHGLKPGVYVVHIKSGNASASKRLVVR